MCTRLMRGFVVDGASGSLRVSVMDVPVPEPADGEALVRVLVAAVCATDIEIMKGYMGFRATYTE